MERICLTANGNLQRVLSSWFNKPIKVQIIKNDNIPICHEKFTANTNPIIQRFDREVNLLCEGKVVCNAISEVLIYDNIIVNLIKNEGIGIGQLFSYILLEEIQPHGGGKIAGVECKIKEIFPNGMFENGWIGLTDFSNEKENLINGKQELKSINKAWFIDQKFS
ncbi:16310_t:CDS:2 [Dentiscutata erythropus]|uniref:16310_t:CDS:1 n=1 Tax=Dentiscutata erythropus TaxID=1348616 RepID=A0A9N9JUV8_9GLOM|nr:16310_t:CDS:2 [Dentiscutata erythropus]